MVAPSLLRLLGGAAVVFALATMADAASAPARHRSEGIEHRGNVVIGDDARALGEARSDGRDEEDIVLTHGIVFQKSGCPQVISEEEAWKRSNDTSLPGNVVRLISAVPGRAGNHFLVVSAYLALGYCCKSKVLSLPPFDNRFTSVESRRFESRHHFFDFSGIGVSPLEEYEGMPEDPKVCPPVFEAGGLPAFYLAGIHPHLLQCMNRVYLRGCEAKYFEPLLRTSDFCEKPPAALARNPPRMPAGDATTTALLDSHTRLRQTGADAEGPSLSLSTAETGGYGEGFNSNSFGDGVKGSAGSLVIHIRSGDIFLPRNAEIMKNSFPGFGQPPLQFYLHAIASQPWSDVSIITFALDSIELNPTFVALEMLQRAGSLGPNVEMHKDRDLLTDIQAMLCADGLAISRSTLHFLTFAHTRAKQYFVPSECGPGTYTRKTRVVLDGTKKPNPNNTTLLCIEKPEAEVYGVEWDVDEDAYGIYNNWQVTDEQLLNMVLFNGIKGLSQCCDK